MQAERRGRLFAWVVVLTAMLCLCICTWAASGRVSITLADGSTTTFVNTADILLHEIGASDVASVTVTDGTMSDTYRDFSKAINKTLTGGTKYQIYLVKSADGSKALRFKYTNGLKDNISITVVGKPVSYSVHANSGAYGQNKNLGGMATCTVSTTSPSTVEGGGSYVVSFSPIAGQEIVKLNLRVDAADGTGKMVDAKSAVVQVGGQPFAISMPSEGTVVVTASPLVRSVYVTALTRDEVPRFALSASTDGHCDANIGSELLEKGSQKDILFTPHQGYVVDQVTVTAGGDSKTFSAGQTTLTVGGSQYTLVRAADGSATLSVPPMAGDVSVSALTANDVNRILIQNSLHVRSDKEGTHYLRDGEAFSFSYLPVQDGDARTLSVTTPSHGVRTVWLDELGQLRGDISGAVHSGGYFDGSFWKPLANSSVLVSRDSRGAVLVQITKISEDMEFQVNAEGHVSEIELRGDEGVFVEEPLSAIDRGDSHQAVFHPAASGYAIVGLKIAYGNKTYSADIGRSEASYVRVDGRRWNIQVADNGTVTLDMTNVENDVVVTASSNYAEMHQIRISKNEGAHTVITHSGSNPFSWDDSVLVTVYTDRDGYVLKEATFSMGETSAVVKPFDQDLLLGGVRYPIVWADNTEFSVRISQLTGNLTLASRAEAGSVSKPSEVRPGPELPGGEQPEGGTPAIPPSGSVGYHTAYMTGYGNGYFGPDDQLTRAQAITLLNRLFAAGSESVYERYAHGNSFSDVSAGDWFAGAVNYAAAMGYLDLFRDASHALMPDAPISRAEYLALLCEYRSVDVSEVSKDALYKDVPAVHWAVQYVNYATRAGWVQGYGNGLFGADSSLTRAEVCVMTNRILGRSADPAAIAAVGPVFNDVPLSFWAFGDILEASQPHYGSALDNTERWAGAFS